MGRSLRSTIALTFAGTLAVGAGCAPRSQAPPGAQRPQTTVIVENRSTYEVHIYVLRSAERIRIGTARPVSTSRFPLPPGLVFGPTTLRFQGDPVGGHGRPVSHEILVSEGDEVVLRIPPS